MLKLEKNKKKNCYNKDSKQKASKSFVSAIAVNTIKNYNNNRNRNTNASRKNQTQITCWNCDQKSITIPSVHSPRS